MVRSLGIVITVGLQLPDDVDDRQVAAEFLDAVDDLAQEFESHSGTVVNYESSKGKGRLGAEPI